MSGINEQKFKELIGAYALGALPETESRKMEEYLEDHPERRSEVDDMASIANLLALSPEEQEPSPQLRSSIMSVVEAEAERRPTGHTSLGARTRGFFSPQRLALGMATLVVLITLASWNVILQGEQASLQNRNQALQARVQELRTQANRTYAMQGAGGAQNASGEVIELGEDRVILVAERLPEISENETYEIWVIRNGVPEPGGLFEPREGLNTAPITASLRGAEVVAVTVEPDGGSPRPTSDPFMVTRL